MDDKIHRGQRAKEIVESEVFKDSVATLREAYIAGLLRCDVRDDLGRARYTEGLRMLDAHKQHLTMVIQTGEVAESELKRLETKPGVVQRLVRTF
jgi:hypothetical protein